jgi:Flp pilus assembly protein TadG
MNKREQGLFLVEFAIIASVMFLILFAVIELSRVIWIWNTADEAARRGARVAAVCPINHPDVKRATVFASYDGGSDTYVGGTNSTILRNLTTGNVDVKYLAGDGVTETTDFQKVRYVSVAIVGYQVTPLIPFIDKTITLPPFETTLPAESLGFIPDPDDPGAVPLCSCFGVPAPCST